MNTIKELDSTNYPIEKSVKVYIRRKPINNDRGVDMAETTEYVGSAIKGQDTLRGLNHDEEKVYLKSILGANPGGDKWEAATRDYWANIRVPIPIGDGRQLEIGFKYKNEDDARVGEESNDLAIKQSLGVPINVSDYIFYRYCLVYKRVARKVEDIYKSANISFFIFNKIDDILDKKRISKLRDQATIKRISILGDRELVDDVLIILNNGSSIEAMNADEKDLQLETYSVSNPAKFVSIVSDANLKSRAFIEKCVSKGLLRRLQNTDTIMYGDNTVLGHTMEEAIITLNRSTPTSTNILNTLKARMKQAGKVSAEEPVEIEVTDIPNLEPSDSIIVKEPKIENKKVTSFASPVVTK